MVTGIIRDDKTIALAGFSHFKSNLRVLELADKEDLSNEFIVRGIINKFFIQLELGEKVLKGLLDYEGQRSSANGSPRRRVKAAVTLYDFIDESIWLDMLKARNNRTQMYDTTEARRFADEILQQYIPEFQRLESGILNRYNIAFGKRCL